MRTTRRAREGDLVARDEAGIIARVRAGETEAYAELMRAYAPVAHRTAVLLGAGADAEDVVQDAFVKAYLALGGFRDGAAFRPWLLRIVARETSNAIRSARRLRSAVDREGALGGTAAVIPESADPAALAMAGERRARLMTALDQLSADQRRVVIYRYLLDLDEAETAEALGWPRGTVKSRLSRALRRLELLLGPDEAERPLARDRSERGARGARAVRSARGGRQARASRGGGAYGRSAGGGAGRGPGRAAGGAAGAGARAGRSTGRLAPGRAG
ncbi:RNA polymerase sigma factor [Streptomyces sp. HD1123-B1]|uniref:RNA polymerase sigma factor n=1 Tax=Streptomyces huangiella TaxID=3228804 RepID=UPI003D7CFA33